MADKGDQMKFWIIVLIGFVALYKHAADLLPAFQPEAAVDAAMPAPAANTAYQCDGRVYCSQMT